MYGTGSGLVPMRCYFGEPQRPGSTQDLCTVAIACGRHGRLALGSVGRMVTREDTVGGDHESDMNPVGFVSGLPASDC